jgi:hypothetical protein
MFSALDTFCTWLSGTAFSQAIQSSPWVIPAVQTVHIVAVAAVVSSILMVDLRLLGLRTRDQALQSVMRRFLPFVWWALVALLTTGGLLIVAEPARALQNPVFFLKMALLLLAAATALACQWPLRRDAAFWDHNPARRNAARLLALASLPLWTGIVFAGRWIAYVQGS